MKRIQGQGCWKASSQWEKVAKCNFKSKAQVHERCFFLMKWNVICNVEDRFWCVLELFCRASHVRASMHRITGLELLRTLMLCLVQLSKWRESKATDAEKLLNERKLLNAILRVTLKYMKDICFSWNEMLFAMQKTDFHV